VVVSTYVSESHAQKIDGIRSGYAEYRSSFKNKQLVKLSYRLGFLAVMLTLLLAAIWVALRVAASITVPIRSLAVGTVEVARGNLDYRVEEQSGDEVGMLVDSFNRMTADLKSSGSVCSGRPRTARSSWRRSMPAWFPWTATAGSRRSTRLHAGSWACSRGRRAGGGTMTPSGSSI